MNVQSNNHDGNQHMIDDINEQLGIFVGVPREIIRRRAEQEAERYVTSTLGLESGSLTYQLKKDNYAENFMDKMKWAI